MSIDVSESCPITLQVVCAPKQVKVLGGPYASTMDASTISADSSTGHDPGETLVVSSGGSSLPGQPGKSGSYPAQTFNGSQTMNFHSGGGAAPAEGSTVASGAGSSGSTAVSVRAVNIGPEMSKGLAGAVMPPSTNSVIQTPLMNSQNAVGASQPASKTVGATVTLARPPVPTARSGATLNENKNASPAVAAGTCATGVAMQTPLVNNIPQANPVSVSAGSHVIKAEPPTTLIQSAPQPAAVPGVPRLPVTMAPGSGAVRAVTPQVLAPRLPHTSPGQPSIHNIQLPHGELRHTFLLTLCALAVIFLHLFIICV